MINKPTLTTPKLIAPFSWVEGIMISLIDGVKVS